MIFQPANGYVWSALLPWNFFDGDANGAVKAFGAGTLGVGIFGAFWSWIGFEMAPNYAEESKDPKRIMSPATYISVIGLGVLYTFICWMLVVSWGQNGITAGVNAQFSGDIASVFYPQTDRVFPIDIGSASLLTRTVPADDRDRLVRMPARVLQHGHAVPLLDGPRGHPAAVSSGARIPRTAARTSRRSSIGVLAGLIIAGFLLYDSSTLAALLLLGTWAPMMGNIGILAIMGLVSLAIIRYFATEAKGELGPLSAIVAPLLAAAIMFGATYLLIDNRNTPRAAAPGVPFVEYMWLPPLVVFIVGMVLALLYRSRDRARYDGIGRYLHEDIST